MAYQIGEGLDRENLDSIDQRRLGGVDGGNKGARQAVLLCQPNHGEDAGGMTQAAIQRELADDQCVADIGRELSGGDEDAERDRQVVGRSLFADVGGGEVDGDPPQRKARAGVADGRAHPLARFLHGGIR